MPAETHVEQGPIGPDEVFRIVRERLAEILEIDEARDHARQPASPETSTPTRSRSSSWSRRSKTSWGSARSASASTTTISATCTLFVKPSTTSSSDSARERGSGDGQATEHRRRARQLLEATIGFVVLAIPTLLEQALAHRSYCAEHADVSLERAPRVPR